MHRVIRTALFTGILSVSLALLAGAAMAQSKARAPMLDGSLKQFIAEMTPIAGPQAGTLDGKVVVVNFFASWCPPCRPEFGYLNKVRQAFAEDDVTILAINLFEDFFRKGKERRMARFLNATRPDFPVLRAEDDGMVEAKFGGVDRIRQFMSSTGKANPPTPLSIRTARRRHTLPPWN
jgi:thiol-disulfide isomerase/thioredoxin